LLGTSLSIARATGLVTFEATPKVGSNTVYTDADPLSPIGEIKFYVFRSLPSSKWIFPSGQALLRASYPDLWVLAQVEIAAGNTDWTAGNGTTTFTVPDYSNYVLVGRDVSASGRITTGGSGIDGTKLGAHGGAETVAITTSQMPSHSHNTDVNFTPNVGGVPILAVPATNPTIGVTAGTNAFVYPSSSYGSENPVSGRVRGLSGRQCRAQQRAADNGAQLHHSGAQMSQLVPVKLPPGMFRNGTEYEASGRWYDGNLVRWLNGRLRPWGGWVKYDQTQTPFSGVARSIVSWRSNVGFRYTAVGTNTKLYVSAGGSYTDATPAGLLTGRADAIEGAGYSAGSLRLWLLRDDANGRNRDCPRRSDVELRPIRRKSNVRPVFGREALPTPASVAPGDRRIRGAREQRGGARHR
jgi:microcystin-dependent protein